MENKKDILIVTGAGVVLVAAALLIFTVPALAGGPDRQLASGCKVTNTEGQVSCPMVNGPSQDATGDQNASGGACH